MFTPALLLTWGLSGVLLWAALAKVRAQRELRATLAALGFGRWSQRVLAPVVPAAEMATGGGLLLVPGAEWPRLGLACLGVIFLVAGVLGLRSEHQVTCACVGVTGGGLLGWTQIILLPGWFAAGYALHRLNPGWPAGEGVQYLAGLVVLLGALRAVLLVREWRIAGGNRRAIDEAVVIRAPIVAPGQKVVTP
ncbi:MAG: MauE/DoxX family redox-associated membrane protein [Pseudonocardiaceae bacterium]